MSLPKPKLNYAAALMSQPQGFNYLCGGCGDTNTVYPQGKAFTYKCWCGTEKKFTGRESSNASNNTVQL